MPKHRKKNRMKIYRIQVQNKWYKQEEDSELDSNTYTLDRQDTEDKQDKPDKHDKQINKTDEDDKQVQSENVIIVPTDSHSLDVWDEISLKEIQAGEHTNLFEEKSNYQNINLVQVNDVRLYLDKQLQFSSVDEQIYHEALVHPIMSKVIDPKRVLILGGGDGLALEKF